MDNQRTPASSEELLQEKDLLAVYLASRKIKVNRPNQYITAGFMIVLFVYALFVPQPLQTLPTQIRSVADYGFTFATSILSFLIAGFTIYLTITKVEHFILMSSHQHSGSGLPWIKYATFSFLRILAVYVFYCLACVAIKLLAAPGGPITLLLNLLSDPAATKLWLARIGYVILGGTTLHLVLLLQSFIFNIYHTSMTALCLEIEKIYPPQEDTSVQVQPSGSAADDQRT